MLCKKTYLYFLLLFAFKYNVYANGFKMPIIADTSLNTIEISSDFNGANVMIFGLKNDLK